VTRSSTATRSSGRLLGRLNAELTTRQSILGAQGTAGLTELRKTQAPDERLPHVVLMVDRFEVFEREFASYDNGSYMERMIRLLRDGAGAGIHVVLAGDRVLGGTSLVRRHSSRLIF
jgi:S-DNA-T family DNA segregation ATPase FtsK/SpoIIIE